MTIEDQAAIESGLAAEYANDPVLLAFYQRKLLQRNWPGSRTATEKEYCRLVYRAKHSPQYPDLPLPHEGADASGPE
jgi:hypothetical protein